MGSTRNMTLEDAVEEFAAVTALHRGDPVEDARNVLLAFMAREISGQRPKSGLKQWADLVNAIAKLKKQLVETRGRLRRHELAVAWALGEGDSDFGDDMKGDQVPVLRYWWRTRLAAIARGPR